MNSLSGEVLSSLGFLGPVFAALALIALWCCYFVSLRLWSDRNLSPADRDPVDLPLRVISSIGDVAPMVGLLGTVVGLWKVLRNLGGVKGSEVRDILSQGLGEAMGTTIVGLCLAMICVVAYLGLKTWGESCGSIKIEAQLTSSGEVKP